MNQHRSKEVIENLETSIAFGSGQHFGSTVPETGYVGILLSPQPASREMQSNVIQTDDRFTENVRV